VSSALKARAKEARLHKIVLLLHATIYFPLLLLVLVGHPPLEQLRQVVEGPGRYLVDIDLDLILVADLEGVTPFPTQISDA
jgi:hypothetical protein